MIQELHLHLGMHKTGTTYLQQVFEENSEQFLSQGIFYPKTKMKNGQHAFFLKEFMDVKVFNNHFWYIADNNLDLAAVLDLCKKNGIKKLFLSSEFFINPIARKSILKLIEFISPKKIIFYLTLRNSNEWLISAWHHYVTYVQTLTHRSIFMHLEKFPNYLNNRFLSEDAIPYYLNDWISKFNNSKLNIVKYDKNSLIDGFLQELNVKLLPINPNIRLNQSMNLCQLQIKYAINQIMIHENTRSNEFHIFINEVLENIKNQQHTFMQTEKCRREVDEDTIKYFNELYYKFVSRLLQIPSVSMNSTTLEYLFEKQKIYTFKYPNSENKDLAYSLLIKCSENAIKLREKIWKDHEFLREKLESLDLKNQSLSPSRGHLLKRFFKYKKERN